MNHAWLDTIIDLNPVELTYYPILISLDKCPRSCMSYQQKYVFETQKTNVKAFNMITNKNEAKTMTKHISCDCKCNPIVQHVIQIKNGIIKHVNVNVKVIVSAKKIIVGI